MNRYCYFFSLFDPNHLFSVNHAEIFTLNFIINFLVALRLWDIECGACLRILEGHEELVRCIRFDNKRIVSGAYDG